MTYIANQWGGLLVFRIRPVDCSRAMTKLLRWRRALRLAHEHAGEDRRRPPAIALALMKFRWAPRTAYVEPVADEDVDVVGEAIEERAVSRSEPIRRSRLVVTRVEPRS